MQQALIKAVHSMPTYEIRKRVVISLAESMYQENHGHKFDISL